MNHPVHKEQKFSVPVLGIEFKLFYVSEVAAMLRVGAPIVYKLIHEEKLRAIKIGRAWKISEEAIASYVQLLNDQHHE